MLFVVLLVLAFISLRKSRAVKAFSKKTIRSTLTRHIASIHEHFYDAPWAQDLVTLLQELHAAAGHHPASSRGCSVLEHKIKSLVKKHRLSGLNEYLWMIEWIKKTNGNNKTSVRNNPHEQTIQPAIDLLAP